MAQAVAQASLGNGFSVELSGNRRWAGGRTGNENARWYSKVPVLQCLVRKTAPLLVDALSVKETTPPGYLIVQCRIDYDGAVVAVDLT